MLGYRRSALLYIGVVTFAATLLGAMLVPPEVSTWRSWELVVAAAFTILVVLSIRYELHLAPSTKVSVETAWLFAGLLLLGAPLTMLVGAVGSALGDRLRGRDPINCAFDAAQTALYLGAAGLAMRWLIGTDHPTLDNPTHLGAVALAAIAMYVINVSLVAGVISLDLQVPYFAIWRQDRMRDLPQHAALFLVGIVPALTLHRYPWAVVCTIFPLVVIYLSLRDNLRLRDQTREAVEALADTVDMRDPGTFQHSRRVAELAEAIARQLGLDPDQVELIRSAGRVHDIGKIAVPDAVLLKPGRLTDEEFALMKKHPVAGAEILDRFPEYRRGRSIVLHHHERWDGKGYPAGLAGRQIPLGARIMAVADSFDAMTSSRPYREGMPVSKALAILREGRGTQWDPEVVDAALAILEPAAERSPASVLAATA